jgi:SNF2 family DNA or RNA helicase
MSSICLRREKNSRAEGKQLIELPEKRVVIKTTKFSGTENKLYERLLDKVASQVEAMKKNGTLVR